MNWSDIASIVFVAVTMNHMGLVSAAEGLVRTKLWIIDCPKCCSFWATLIYMLMVSHDIITIFAASFLASYSALWLELLEAYIDRLYLWLYGKIITTDTDDTAASDADGGDSAGTVP